MQAHHAHLGSLRALRQADGREHRNRVIAFCKRLLQPLLVLLCSPSRPRRGSVLVRSSGGQQRKVHLCSRVLPPDGGCEVPAIISLSAMSKELQHNGVFRLPEKLGHYIVQHNLMGARQYTQRSRGVGHGQMAHSCLHGLADLRIAFCQHSCHILQPRSVSGKRRCSSCVGCTSHQVPRWKQAIAVSFRNHKGTVKVAPLH
mmetsp:Transcript_59266/g.111723  ORF Transcript_59266/g.111723 Transcript_59266/m.111723 type:complete len:201 (+) Transcript_59266:308-910(+)